ncbi:MAG: NAD-dependent DNA ligase LigA [Clostridia bacterium]|nr:NAD-dependent DNA ligase LigA [Clostridia bacterium]MDD4387135.1 NAD-dependent DNA ligase LigA [Clostridia bacterium]
MEQIDMFENKEKALDLKRINKLRKEIKNNNIAYHIHDKPLISDFEYDKLTQELRKLEMKYPESITLDSPTQNIGGEKKDIFSDVKHEVPMQSLQDVFNFEDVLSFTNKIRKEYGKEIEFVVETKIDGLSVSLEYEEGKLVRGSTRGDGLVGEDVTANILCIKSIPDLLPVNDTIEVRGEVYLPRSEFNRLNKELELAGKKLLANPRNAAAGTLRQLNTELVKHRDLNIFVFNVQKCTSKKFTKHSESLDYCKNLGIHTLEYSKICKTDDDVISSIEDIGKLRDNLEYDIDGAVVKINDLKLRNTLGTTVKVPKWAVAYKYPPEQRETSITDIIIQVGRTGKLTPMAVLNPVKVAGSIISSATLHNFDYIKEKDIRIGDICVVQKAGDVIPEIDHIIKENRNGTEIEIEVPTVCPVCGENLEKDEEIVDIRCINLECPSLIYRSILHFASRDCMDISGLGDSITEKLIDNNMVQDVADIYYLKYEDFLELDNFKDKSANNLINSINSTKNNSLDKLIFGLGIRNIGKKAAKVLSENYEDIYEIMDKRVEELTNLSDFGLVMAESVVNFFRKDKTKEIINKLQKAGVNLKGRKKDLLSNKLEALTFCITGSFDNYSRDDIANLIEQNGGKYASTVSKKTSYLVAGEDGGSKLQKAELLGVKIITINELNEII